MSWVRIWVHLVFRTKNSEPFLATPELRSKMFEHIKTNASKKEIWLDCVNGYKDHAHCLISLGREQTISKLVQLIKGESSAWTNKNEIIQQKFMWQDDYWAVSVSESHLVRVRKYIHNQEAHHQKESFSKEIDRFMNIYGWSYVKES